VEQIYLPAAHADKIQPPMQSWTVAAHREATTLAHKKASSINQTSSPWMLERLLPCSANHVAILASDL
jgi:hypothetical protein